MTTREQLENIHEMTNWHWRNTMRPVRFFAFDCRAAIPFLFLLVYARLITFIIAIVSLFVFWYLERKDLTVPAALRKFRSWLCGRGRPGWLHFRHRRFFEHK